MLLSELCRACHNAIRAAQIANGEVPAPVWAEAPAWERRSTRAAVLMQLACPHMSAEREHARWLKEKEAHGWKRGPVRNNDSKLHPGMVPWASVPPIDKVKSLFFAELCRDAEVEGLSDVYEARGYAAFEADTELDLPSNPYPVGTSAHDAWAGGYSIAQSDYERGFYR